MLASSWVHIHKIFRKADRWHWDLILSEIFSTCIHKIGCLRHSCDEYSPFHNWAENTFWKMCRLWIKISFLSSFCQLSCCRMIKPRFSSAILISCEVSDLYPVIAGWKGRWAWNSPTIEQLQHKNNFNIYPNWIQRQAYCHQLLPRLAFCLSLCCCFFGAKSYQYPNGCWNKQKKMFE